MNSSFVNSFFKTAGLQFLGRVLALISGVIFARMLGPEEFGRFVLSIITLLALPAIAGLPELIIRETARYRTDREFGLILGIWSWATNYVVLVSIFSLSIFFFLLYLGVWQDNITYLLTVGVILVPLKAMLPKIGGSITGLRRPELAQLPIAVFSPLFIIIAITILYLLDFKLSALYLFKFQIVTHVVCLLLSILILKSLSKKYSILAKPVKKSKIWSRALFPFAILTLVGTMNNELGTIFLGFFSHEEDVAFFKVATQAILVLVIGLQAVNAVSGPRIAALYKQGDLHEMQVVLKQSVRLSFVSSLPCMIALLLFGDKLIVFFFGSEYLPAYDLILILMLGQVFNICMGSVGLVLNMTGNEKVTLRAQAFTLILTVFLLIVTIPYLQGLGAAIAISLGLISWNILMAIDVYRLTGLKTWIH